MEREKAETEEILIVRPITQLSEEFVEGILKEYRDTARFVEKQRSKQSVWDTTYYPHDLIRAMTKHKLLERFLTALGQGEVLKQIPCNPRINLTIPW